MNPNDAFAWEIPEKDLKLVNLGFCFSISEKNEEGRIAVREDGILENIPVTFTGQIEKPNEIKANGALDKARKPRKRQRKPVVKKTKVLETFEEVDYSEYFMTNEAFSSKEELKEWAKSTGREHDMFLITQSTKIDNVFITCERYGKARNTGKTNVTKKCQCPFMLSGRKKRNGVWKLSITNGKHNHPLKIYDYGSSLVSRLTQEQYETTAALLKNNVKPKDILEHLRKENPGIKTSLRHIYNARTKIKAEAMSGRTLMQQLMQCIEENKYVKWLRADPSTGQIMDVMFVHRESIELLKLYPYVLQMNSTYETNKYKTSLLEIVGATPVGKSFNVAVAFSRNGSEEHYRWAMWNLKSLFDDGVGPGAIVTRREVGLMKALDCVFPETHHLLCLNHVDENVQLNAAKHMGGKGAGAAFRTGLWKRMVDSQSVPEFEMCYGQILQHCKSYGPLLTYIQETWLVHKENFVRAWTDQVMHFGNTTMNIVESVHSSLKSWLCSSTDKFDVMWKLVDSQLEGRIDEIFIELDKSSKTESHAVTYPWSFRNLAGVVTHEALKKMDHEHRAGWSRGLWKHQEKCSCSLRSTHGLPCEHEIAEKERDRNIIYSDEIHLFWRTTGVNCLPKIRAKEAAKARLVGLLDELRLLPQIEQNKILDELFPYIDPEKEPPAQLPKCPPEENVSTLSSSGSIEETSASFDLSEFVPAFVVPFVLSWVNNGNCGYRCVAEVVMGSQDHWMEVRKALFTELSDRFEMYTTVYGGGMEGEQHVARMMSSLCHWTDTSAPAERWMNLSDMGLVIATCYNAMVVEISGKQKMTHLPLVSPDGFGRLSCVMAVGYEETPRSFILLRMCDEFPVPPFNPQWLRYKEQSVSYLESLFDRRCRMWDLLSAAML
ncbi:PREDICTED: uncharacterized protein LOC105972579 isoform X2 [Erythranthe guttata]|uniref:uncharacterized protein LOC105972579 isoform X2 n=1 Tax=Erythranthe guttata TaxID=4155 RepID=UPI00064DB14B|nr:PREDICTED: uncharacterized protein LOC105972579 isoform X2 [Erythranthe guttata]|eukprot:XP_012852997.1 PREDICTED: uncharacterized protein LOC105972579 isoform X2 [Erythranthe guttata]